MRVGFRLDAMPLTPLLPIPKAYKGKDGEAINKALNQEAFKNPQRLSRNVRPPFWNTGWNVGVVSRLTNG